jgi:hypothetical protein
VVLFLKIVWNTELSSQNLWHTSVFFSIFCFSYCFNFSSDAPNLLFIHDCGHVTILLRHIEGNFTYKENYHYHCHFPGLEFKHLPESNEDLPSPKRQW